MQQIRSRACDYCGVDPIRNVHNFWWDALTSQCTWVMMVFDVFGSLWRCWRCRRWFWLLRQHIDYEIFRGWRLQRSHDDRDTLCSFHNASTTLPQPFHNAVMMILGLRSFSQCFDDDNQFEGFRRRSDDDRGISDDFKNTVLMIIIILMFSAATRCRR